MIRYRCPHCAALIVAHERRAGQSSVCKGCVKPHPIPADPALWLNERGESLGLAPAGPPTPEPAPEPVAVPAPAASVEPDHLPEPSVVAEPVVVEPRPVPAFVPEPSPLPPAAARMSMSEFVLPEALFEVPGFAPVPAPPPAVAAREPEPEPEPDVPELSTLPAGDGGSISPRREPDVPALPTRASVAVIAAPERPAVPAPRPEPAVVAVAARPAVSTATPAPRAGRFAPVAPDAPRADPVQLQTQADIAAALTAALASRMKPAEAPRRDLRPSTAAWMLLTAVGVVLVVMALFTDAGYRWPLLAVGLAQVALGYVWIVRLTRFRDPARGVLCAIPPLTIFYLAQYKYAKFRPVRFVLTGAALVAVAGAVPALAPHTRKLVGRSDGTPPPNPASQSKLAQLRAAREQRSYESLARQLDVLAKTDPLLSADKNDRAELSAELRGLCDHPDTAVKVRAIAAYATWDPAGAKAVCLAAVRSPSADVRDVALRLLPQWPDAESARAVQSLIGRRATTESSRAERALEEIGGAAAEQAALALLNRAEDQTMKLTALSVLEKVGGGEIAGWLQSSYAAAADDPAVRDRALATAEAIKARVRAPAPKADPKPAPK
jgi:hypothetical protein